jgi:small subunit ribosomal protein S15
MLTKEKKQKVFKKYGRKKSDTGSPEAQIAYFTERIKDITGHLSHHEKDNGALLSLRRLVNKRRKLLRYLRNNNIKKYRNLKEELNIRD